MGTDEDNLLKIKIQKMDEEGEQVRRKKIDTVEFKHQRERLEKEDQYI